MKRIVLIGGAVLVLLLLAVAALPFLIDPNAFRPMLEARLSQALGREVKLGELKLSILSGSVTANDLSIADDPAYSRTPFVQAKSLAIGVEVWPLIASRQLHVTGLTIDGARHRIDPISQRRMELLQARRQPDRRNRPRPQPSPRRRPTWISP